MKNNRAFTLLEVLLVIAIIAILSGIVIIAINPIKQLGQVRDSQRMSDLNTLNKALISYQIDKRGLIPVDFPTSLTEICDTGNKTSSEILPGDCDGFYDLSFLVPVYLVAIPKDPVGTSGFIEEAYAALSGTKYKVILKNSRFGLMAEGENGEYILLNLNEEEIEEEEETFSCGDIIEYQGESYPTVQIDDQCWISKNLKNTNYKNGDALIDGTTNWHQWDNLVGKWAYLNNNPDNDNLGKLYNWYAVADSRGICPEGWHVPVASEWDELESFLGSNPGTKLKVDSSNVPPWDGNNSSGFSAIPVGIRWSGGGFSSYGVTYFWTSEDNASVPTRQLANYNSALVHTTNSKPEGLSIRCLKDD